MGSNEGSEKVLREAAKGDYQSNATCGCMSKHMPRFHA
jgi:hypothetical protein